MRINYATILRWIRKFGNMIEEYADTLEPSLSEQWHADKMAINVKDRWMWLWNVMDKDTRFMLASLISEKRQIDDARKVFRRAKGCREVKT